MKVMLANINSYFKANSPCTRMNNNTHFQPRKSSDG